MNMSWQPIETAPKDGTPVLCGWQRSGDRGFLVWKHNHRIKHAHEQGSMMDHAEDYFGDPIEYDDYDLALPSGGPTHWFDLPRLQQ